MSFSQGQCFALSKVQVVATCLKQLMSSTFKTDQNSHLRYFKVITIHESHSVLLMNLKPHVNSLWGIRTTNCVYGWSSTFWLAAVLWRCDACLVLFDWQLLFQSGHFLNFDELVMVWLKLCMSETVGQWSVVLGPRCCLQILTFDSPLCLVEVFWSRVFRRACLNMTGLSAGFITLTQTLARPSATGLSSAWSGVHEHTRRSLFLFNIGRFIVEVCLDEPEERVMEKTRCCLDQLKVLTGFRWSVTGTGWLLLQAGQKPAWEGPKHTWSYWKS